MMTTQQPAAVDYTAQDLIRQLGEALAAHTPPRIPVNIDLWGYAEIGAFLKVTPTHVAVRYATRADFPCAIRLPSAGPGRAHPRYKACEVIRWADQYKDKL